MTYQQTAAPRLYEVRFKNGQIWRGTKRQFLLEHPDWYPHAVPVEQETSDVLPLADFADDPHPKAPSSAIRYDMPALQGATKYHKRPVQTNMPQRRSATQDVPVARQRRRFHFHPLALLGMGALAALFIWIGAAWVTTWWSGVQDDWKYTSTFRTYSVDQAVGHNGDSAAKPFYCAE